MVYQTLGHPCLTAPVGIFSQWGQKSRHKTQWGERNSSLVSLGMANSIVLAINIQYSIFNRDEKFSLSNIIPRILFFLIFQWGLVIFQWEQNFMLNFPPGTIFGPIVGGPTGSVIQGCFRFSQMSEIALEIRIYVEEKPTILKEAWDLKG